MRPRAVRRRLAAAAALAVAASAGSPTAAEPAPERTGKLRVGELVLHRCGDGTRWWCGTLRRALDPARLAGPRIGVDFRWLPVRRPGGGHPPLVAVEGGPGYPSTGSRVEFTGIYGPLLRERDLLLVDNRGTGGSALIDCPRVQRFAGNTSRPVFPRLVAGCARWIERRHRRPGRPLHAPDLFATAYATADLAAVIRALRLGRIDLFGDSYGTFFVQSFISRYPELLHSVTIDSSYPVRGLDPWYASSGETARRAMDAVCERDAGCAAAAPGSATERLAQVLERLRERPVAGTTRDSDGSRVRTRFGVREVVDLVQDAASDPTIYRELDASVRAALAGDELPLLRLVAQSRSYLHGANSADYFSNGLYWAVACMDYPQLFSMRASPKRRRAQLAARLLDPPAGAFDPFTAREWIRMTAYSQPYTGCLDWPRPVHRAPVVPAKPRPLPARTPLLVVGGDLDSLTPLADVRAIAPSLARNVRVVELPNTTHVTSQGYTHLMVGARCARRIIRAFVRAPRRLASLDASCAARIPPVHTAGAYPATLAAAAPARLEAGPDPGVSVRQAATVAAGALADAPVRHFYSGAARGPGLRGGSFTARGGDVVRLVLRRVRFVQDATVSGTGRWRLSNGAHRGSLVVRLPGAEPVRVRLAWTQRSRLASARIGDASLSLPAP
jgi:pimeloyl-ACP methyl ester carboxylesterase